MLKIIFDFVLENWMPISALLYELAVRLFPTQKNLSIIDLIFKVLSVIVPNKKKVIPVILFLMLSVSAFAQLNTSTRLIRFFPVQSEYDTVSGSRNYGTIWYDLATKNFRGMRSDGTKFTLPGSGGGGGGVYTAGSGLTLDGTSFKLGGTVTEATSLTDAGFSNGISYDPTANSGEGVINLFTNNYTEIVGIGNNAITLQQGAGNFTLDATGFNFSGASTFTADAPDGLFLNSGATMQISATDLLNVSSDAGDITINSGLSTNINAQGGDLILTKPDDFELRIGALDNFFGLQGGGANIRYATMYSDNVSMQGASTFSFSSFTASYLDDVSGARFTINNNNDFTIDHTGTSGEINITTGEAGINVSALTNILTLIGDEINTTSKINTTASTSLAPINIGSLAGDPSGLNNGDIWYNTTTNKFRARENGVSVNLIGSGGGLSTANNGLTATGSNIQLGGALVANTSITGNFILQHGTAGSPLSTYSARSTNNLGLTSDNGIVEIVSTRTDGTQPGFTNQRSVSGTNIPVVSSEFRVFSNGTAANGFGLKNQFYAENSTGTSAVEIGSNSYTWTDVTSTSEDAQYLHRITSNGSPTIVNTITSTAGVVSNTLNGVIIMPNLPTSCGGAVTGTLWNDAGTLKICP